MEPAPSLSRVICAGECLIDLIADSGADLVRADRFAIREGGAPLNLAVGLARLAVPSAFCGVAGDDPFGSRLRSLLEKEGVDATRQRLTKEADTSLALAWRDDRGDGRFRLLRMADRLLAPDDIERAGIPGAAALVVGSVALAESPSREAINRAVSIASAAGVPVVFDVNVRPTLWPSRAALLDACEPILSLATVVKLSQDDARELWGCDTAAEAIAEMGWHEPWLTVITDGERGVHLHDPARDEIREYDVFEVEAVDPTGAGDAFMAALLSRLIDGGWSRPDDDDMAFAMAAGALATTRQGAIPALPDRAAIQAFLADRAAPAR
ncbi:MAG: carbohydrate kinase [Chloroflexia bacterium]|nr:carbohydrate kinase [Chloroflexia bacterium]